MNALAAEVIRGDPSRELRAWYVEDSGSLVVGDGHDDSWPYGATLDGLLTLDLNRERGLAHAELLLPRSRWPRGRITAIGCRLDSTSVLRLPALTTASVPPLLEVLVIQGDKALQVRFGPEASGAVSLGPGVWALLHAKTLVGFEIGLREITRP